MKAREILDRDGNGLYLSRWYLMGSFPGFKGLIPSIFGMSLYLHKIHRSDNAGALHNHPWRWAVSFILRRGYFEERGAVRRRVLPFTLNVIRETDFHRVDLIGGKPAWTLFLVGPRVKDWGFLVNGVVVHWQKFIEAHRNGR